ncbi:MAG: hypothetical protein AB1345_09595 [Chloroflexota bacterium]
MKRLFVPVPTLLIVMFFISRVFLLMGLPVEGIRTYGDLPHFYHLASLPGFPFKEYWVEYPPILPLVLKAVFTLSGGREHVFDVLFAFLMTLFQVGNLVLFNRIADRLWDKDEALPRMLVYGVILLGLAYGWRYAEPLVVFSLLLALWFTLRGEDGWAGLSLIAGTLLKWFPVVALIVVWRERTVKQALKLTTIVLLCVAVVWLGLYCLSPQMTLASLVSQFSKGSWETVWALIDGNFRTGVFSPVSERFDPANAFQTYGNPPVVSPWLTLLAFGNLGLWLFVKAKQRGAYQAVGFLGLTLSLFFLWSPGWSPQWVLYLIPLILLVLPWPRAFLLTVLFVLVNLLEWPLLLSRGLFGSLWLTILLRTLLFVLAAWLFWGQISQRGRGSAQEGFPCESSGAC